METSIVFVYEAEADQLADCDISVSELTLADGVESLPIFVELSNSPSDAVTVTLTAVFD